MSYAIYKTEAIILRVIPSGEASSDVVFFTREFGKITTRVQSARKIESKMRMHLTKYNHVVIDMVRGKNMWRLTGITTIDPTTVFHDRGLLHAWHRMVSLAEFLIRGEEVHEELFNFFINMMHSSKISNTKALELFGVIHVLDMLGYWHGERLSKQLTEDVLEYCHHHTKTLVKMINESIEATQIVV